MRNREQSPPEEISKNGPENEKKPLNKKEISSTLWRKIKDGGKVAAIVTLLSMPGIRSLKAQEKGEGRKIKTKERIEKLVENSAEKVQKIISIINEKGQEGTMGNTPVKRLESSDGSITTVGYSDDNYNNEMEPNESEWLLHGNEKASMSYLDEGANGSIDRIVLNNDKTNKFIGEKRAFNKLNSFVPMETLADKAKIKSSLEPKDQAIYEMNNNENEYSIKVAEFENGKTSLLSGKEAKELTEKIQAHFYQEMSELLDNIEK
ncbi:MAG: hypothetical protein U5L76_00870 [Patescibacteria group bacterium]|nr:hypothetical protein [Patescibacteria group bacterium]